MTLNRLQGTHRAPVRGPVGSPGFHFTGHVGVHPEGFILVSPGARDVPKGTRRSLPDPRKGRVALPRTPGEPARVPDRDAWRSRGCSVSPRESLPGTRGAPGDAR